MNTMSSNVQQMALFSNVFTYEYCYSDSFMKAYSAVNKSFLNVWVCARFIWFFYCM